MNTIVDVLAGHAHDRPQALLARFIDGDEGPVELTYAAAWREARRWAKGFDRSGLEPGTPVLLSLHNEPDFVPAYFGALIAGAVPVPIAPAGKADAADPRMGMIAERLAFLDATHVVLSAGVPDLAAACRAAAPAGSTILTAADIPDDDGGSADDGRSAAGLGGDLDLDPDSLGLIQFSSGTSGTAKAVELTQRALLGQVRRLNAALGVDATDSAVSWLPFFHDMGLIGFLLAPVYLGASVTVVRTESFLRNPRIWPRTISRYEPSVTGGPPSAYGLVARFVREADRRRYDLGSLKAALVAAEMIEPATLRAFADAFEASGFRSQAFVPAYGLAENALAVTMTPSGSGVVVDRVDPEVLQATGRARPANGASAREITSVGEPVPGTEIVIADAAGVLLEERQVGQILVRSDSLMRGYVGGGEVAIRDGWLWTGDMGYLSEGRLYITGRAKELIIVGGANYYPDDLERVAGAVRGVRQGRAVAFSVPSPGQSTEQVVVLVETAVREAARRDEVRGDVRRALTAAGLPVHEVGLVPPRFIRSTDTGKVKRIEARQRYVAGELDGAT